MAGAATPVALLLLTAVLLAGCSGGGDGTHPSSSSSSSSGPSVSVSASASASATSSSNGTSSSSPTSTGPAPLSGSVARDILDNSFPDGTFTVAKGTTVTWTDKGSNPHSVTADDGSFDSSPNCPPACMTSLPGTNAYSRTFDAAGSFPYHCRVHASMTGTVTVV